MTNNSLPLKLQYESARLALPPLIDLISVPVSMMPAVSVSTRKYSKVARLFLILMLFVPLLSIMAAKVSKNQGIKAENVTKKRLA
jgi:hypothetical protein